MIIKFYPGKYIGMLQSIIILIENFHWINNKDSLPFLENINIPNYL